MKKVVIAFCAAALVLLGTVSVFAAGGVYGANARLQGACGKQMKECAGVRGANCVDTDKDGVCDNRASECIGSCGENYADTDVDGVCDNQASECTGRCGNGTGFGSRMGGGCRGKNR